MRFKVLEEKLRSSNGNPKLASEGRSTSTGISRRQSLGGAELTRLSSNGYLSRRNTNSHTGSLQSNSASALLKTTKISSRSFDGGSRSLERDKLVQDAVVKDNSATITSGGIPFSETTAPYEENEDGISVEKTKTEQEDLVSGALYDMMQKEVISLRKACHERDVTLKDKDDAIEVKIIHSSLFSSVSYIWLLLCICFGLVQMLAKKVDTLNKAMEVEAKKMRREVVAMEKELAAMRVSSRESDQRPRRQSAPRGAVVGSQSLPVR